MPFEFARAEIPDIVVIQPSFFRDDRGFFMESYKRSDFAAHGITEDFVQSNHSRSPRGIVRGLHYQKHPKAQGKLVRTLWGEVFDVAVDLRSNSPMLGKWVGVVLSAENKKQLWIPEGFAHGFFVLSDSAEILYKTTDYYAPEDERCLIWNDPEIGIDWPKDGAPILSAKDRLGLPLSRAEVFA